MVLAVGREASRKIQDFIPQDEAEPKIPKMPMTRGLFSVDFPWGMHLEKDVEKLTRTSGEFWEHDPRNDVGFSTFWTVKVSMTGGMTGTKQAGPCWGSCFW